MLKWLAGAAAAGLLLARPEAAAGAARDALALWYRVVAPGLFPFMALLPLLTCPEGLHIYEAMLGGPMRRLFRLPGTAASAMAVGMMAGSPAGCLAARRAAGGLNRGQLERLAAACCGMSPGFLISGVGAGMLGSAALGHVLLRSQMAAQFLLLLLPGRGGPVLTSAAPEVRDGPAGGAVSAILSVGGYMALFAAVAGALGALIGEAAGRAALAVMDVTAGARIVCAMDASLTLRLTLLSALTAFGGACVCAQNFAALAGCGVRIAPFFARRCIAAAASALFTYAQCRWPWEISVNFEPDAMKAACLCACLMAIPAILKLKETYC